MGFDDRPYNREGFGGGFSRPPGVLGWLLAGDVPLFTAFGIRVRAHASLVIYAALVLLLGLPGTGWTVQDRVINVTVLFAVVLLHEFGHCFAARYMGGEADDILMHPLGGLALTRPPHAPWPTFVTVAGGPLVNVALMLVSGAVLYGLAGRVPPLPFWSDAFGARTMTEAWVFWFYQINYFLLAFNLLPIYPLDGGQMVQCALWPKLGYHRSMYFSTTVGMAAALVGGLFALFSGRVGLAILAAFGFYTCYQLRKQLAADAPEPWAQSLDPAYAGPSRAERRASERARRQAERDRAEEQREQVEVDAILAKVSREGMASLTRGEQQALRDATERQRARDARREAKFKKMGM